MYTNLSNLLLMYGDDKMRKDILERKVDIEKWIELNLSKAEISRRLNCKVDTLNRYLQIMKIEYGGNQSGKGFEKNRVRMSLEEYLLNSKDIQSNKVRKKLLEEGYKEHRCENCGLTEWLGNPIPLELHHKDGNNHNNTLNNFELRCPNCHALTDSYRGKNCKKS